MEGIFDSEQGSDGWTQGIDRECDITIDSIVEDVEGTTHGSATNHIGAYSITEENIECESPTKGASGIIKQPFVGMEFNTSEDSKSHYERYGVSKGYSVFTKSSQKSWARYDGVTCILFVCSHYGNYDKKVDKNVPVEKQRPNTSTMRSGCNAHMRILLNAGTLKWVIRSFDDDHNHSLVSLSKRILLKPNRKIHDVAKNMVETFNLHNLPVNRVKCVLGGDRIDFNSWACWNHLRDVRQKLEVGDAQLVFQYFQKRYLENPQFFHAIQCDGEGRAVNLFWVDARSCMSYQQFGDVVSFDTTYKTNKYRLPFAPFTGVNHHFQTIQSGCALLQDETEDSFIWLFETWKKAMGGVAPISMITDSDPAMRAAIPKVFPSTLCRLCYWNIKKKFGEKLAHVYFKRSNFKKEMKKCLKSTFKIEDFEKKWRELMTEYDLENNTLLQKLYEDRTAWVPVYIRTSFFAGMNSTGRSEGIIAFFKDYININTTLVEFVHKYEQALRNIEMKERDEDYESEQKSRLFTERSLILEHAGRLYTRNMFKRFRAQWQNVEIFKCDVASDETDTYFVRHKHGITTYWTVYWNPYAREGTCECHQFEFIGIPCVHIMKEFSRLDLKDIPDFFIKKRWLKGANKFRSTDKQVSVSQEQVNAMRLNHLCQEATQLACFAYQSEEGYKMMLDCLREVSQRIPKNVPSGVGDKDDNSVSSTVDATEQHVIGDPAVVEPIIHQPTQVILNPNVSQTKGGQKNENGKGKESEDARYKSPIEMAQGKKHRRCSVCDMHARHNARTCPKRSQFNGQAEVRNSD